MQICKENHETSQHNEFVHKYQSSICRDSVKHGQMIFATQMYQKLEMRHEDLKKLTQLNAHNLVPMQLDHQLNMHRGSDVQHIARKENKY